MNCASESSCDSVAPPNCREIARGAVIALAVASLALATGACAQPAHLDPKAATAQAVWDRVTAAKPGDRIRLVAGDYGALNLAGRKFAAPGVVIEAAPGAKVTFSSIEFDHSEGITIKGVEVNVTAANFGVMVGNSSRITLSGLKIHAPANTAPNAMMLRNSSEVTVEDCDIRDVSFGVAFLDSNHLKILRNNFSDLQVDAIRGSSSYVEVIGNHATNFHPQDGDHPDFIQFWGAASGRATSNVIKDNVFERGDGKGAAQGVFIEDNDDVVITGNALFGTMYNAIAVSRVHHAQIEGNFIQGFDDMGVKIIVRGQSSDVTVRDNVTPMVSNYTDDGKPNAGFKAEGNRSIRNARPGDTKDLQAWLAKRNAAP